MRKGMFWRMLAKSLRYRARRRAVAILAVLLGSSLVAALGSLSLDVEGKAGQDLRAYGANIILSPRAAVAPTGIGGLEFGVVQEERYLPEADLAVLAQDTLAEEVVGFAPYLYGSATVGGKRVSLAGVSFERVRLLSPWWQVTGEWPGAAGPPGVPVPALLGTKLATAWGLAPGAQLDLEGAGGTASLVVAGVVETGAAEDGQVFVPLPVAQQLLGQPGLVSSVQISALAKERPLAAVAAELEQAVAGTRARVVGQIAEAEASVLGKVRLLVGMVAGLVLLSAGLAVGSTMTASVLERTREVGLLRALGAEESRIAAMFVAEAATIAVAGGAAGYAAGIALAAGIGRLVFGAPIAPSLLAAPATLVVALGVCLLASALPIRRALRIDAARALRGE